MISPGIVKKGIREKGGQGFMDKKIIPIIAGLVFFGSLIVLQGVFGQQEAKEVINIEYPEHHTKDRYQAVQFAHKKHADAYKDCKTCHHTWKEGENVKKCVECHKKETKDSAIKLEKAFHNNCRNCHRNLKKAGKATGPTICTKCHPKK
jgi:hypothetical protein